MLKPRKTSYMIKMQHTAKGEGHGSLSKAAGSIGNISRGSPCRNNDPGYGHTMAYHMAGLPRGISALAQHQGVCCLSSAEGKQLLAF